MNQTILQFVMQHLAERKGDWPKISKDMAPKAWRSYYSWLAKLAQGHIPDPGVNRIQRLADYFGSFATQRHGERGQKNRNVKEPAIGKP